MTKVRTAAQGWVYLHVAVDCWVAGAPAVTMEVMLDSAPAAVQGVACEEHDVEGVHDRGRVGEFLGGGGLEAGNPSIATTSRCSRQGWGRSASQVLNACLERPSTISSRRQGPMPSRTGVKSMIAVTYFSPRRVWRHTCSSTPITATPSNRPGSSIRTRRPSARTASLAVFNEAANA